MEDDLQDREPADSAPRPIDELCALIMSRHHAYVHRVIPDLSQQLDQLAAAADASAVVGATRAAFADLAQQLEGHLAKEENLLFPALQALAAAERRGGQRPDLPFPTVLYPIRLMEAEHARIEAAMAHVREITRGFAAAENASGAWRQCLSQFARLDDDLQAHFHLENEVLFPGALELERRLG